ncbi:MAG: thioredoxin family protein [Muribaculaceae bacterium]|nr:thioredoxin family protein [Muribaculaceae bacterium]
MFPRLLILPILALALSACGDTRPTKDSTTPADKPAAEMQAATASRNTVRVAADEAITPDPKLPLVIDFSAVWCPPCRKFGPIFHAVAEEMAGKAVFVTVDVDKSPTPAVQFGVSSIPQVSVMMPDGKVISSVGYMTADELKNFINSAQK